VVEVVMMQMPQQVQVDQVAEVQVEQELLLVQLQAHREPQTLAVVVVLEKARE
jgi:hypothetical protein